MMRRQGKKFSGELKMDKARILIGLALVLCVVNVAVSGVSAYETFGYEPGQLVGKTTPVLGFTGAWGSGGGNPAQCTVQSASLAYTGATSAYQNSSGMFQVLIPVWDGARLGRYLNTDPNGPFSEYINNYGRIGKTGKTIYISFLMKTNYINNFYAFELHRDALDDPGNILYVGDDDIGGQTQVQVCAYRNRNTAPSNIGYQFQWLGAATTNTELYVIRIDFGASSGGYDNVTVHRNPSLDAEPIKAPDLLGSGYLDFSAISLASWVDPAGRVGQFDEICIASTYADAVRFYNKPNRAQSPTPADGAVNITGAPGVTLSWTAGSGSAPTGYKVYFSSVVDDVLTESAAAYKGTTTSTSMAISTINTDTTYYWSVKKAMADANDVPGVLWMFATNKKLPVIVSHPVPQHIFAGSNASFTFDVTSETTASYQWYNAGGVLTNTGNIGGAQTKTLTVTGAQIANENNYYCKATNAAGTITSNTAELLIKRTVGYWALNKYTGTDPNLAWPDLSGSQNNLRPAAAYSVPASFVYDTGVDGTANGALVYDGTFALGTIKPDGTMNNIPVGNYPYTMSLWLKTTTGDSGVFGWGNYGTAMQCTALNLNWDAECLRNYWWGWDLTACASYSLIDGNWHHVVVTYDGDYRVIYIDGLAKASDYPNQHEVQTSANFLIGKTNTTNPTGEFYTGALDEVKVYNYALTAVNVAQAYTDIKGVDVCLYPPLYDLDKDCSVDLDDFTLIASEWLNCGLYPSCASR
jgi:hypothetical protein